MALEIPGKEPPFPPLGFRSTRIEHVVFEDAKNLRHLRAGLMPEWCTPPEHGMKQWSRHILLHRTSESAIMEARSEVVADYQLHLVPSWFAITRGWRSELNAKNWVNVVHKLKVCSVHAGVSGRKGSDIQGPWPAYHVPTVHHPSQLIYPIKNSRYVRETSSSRFMRQTSAPPVTAGNPNTQGLRINTRYLTLQYKRKCAALRP
jgi:hypothetical protein